MHKPLVIALCLGNLITLTLITCTNVIQIVVVVAAAAAAAVAAAVVVVRRKSVNKRARDADRHKRAVEHAHVLVKCIPALQQPKVDACCLHHNAWSLDCSWRVVGSGQAGEQVLVMLER